MEFRLLNADEIDCRISSVGKWGIQLLLYKDARVDMNILDETFGVFGWQRKHKLIDGKLFCSVGVYDPKLNCWVWKQDVGVESYTEKEKGQASDAFKRACFNIGIGRELYTAPQMFVRPDYLQTLTQDNGRWTCKDYFVVTDIQYAGRKIASVTIWNTRTGASLEFKNDVPQTIGKIKAQALETLCKEKGIKVEVLLNNYKVASLADLTEEQHLNAIRRLEKS